MNGCDAIAVMGLPSIYCGPSYESLGGQFTIILIAHRLSTVERCDLVVELDRGQVVAQGSYGELMARSTSFARLSGMINLEHS